MDWYFIGQVLQGTGVEVFGPWPSLVNFINLGWSPVIPCSDLVDLSAGQFIPQLLTRQQWRGLSSQLEHLSFGFFLAFLCPQHRLFHSSLTWRQEDGDLQRLSPWLYQGTSGMSVWAKSWLNWQCWIMSELSCDFLQYILKHSVHLYWALQCAQFVANSNKGPFTFSDWY